MYTNKDLLKEYDIQSSYRRRAIHIVMTSKFGTWKRQHAFELYLHFCGRCRMIHDLLIKSVSVTA